ncbi:MAG TPA: VWA domain-containing protein [Rhizobacter sp.]|nr:VWA domain-containing protein [Rhizobacter sp.]
MPIAPPRSTLPALLISLLLSACSATAGERDTWPPAWQDAPPNAAVDFTPPAFEAPSATHCHRLPSTREVPGGGREQADGRRRGEAEMLSRKVLPGASARSEAAGAAPLAAPVAEAPAMADAARSAPKPQPDAPPRPPRETVTAGMVDDNADFGEYLAYRQRTGQLPVRERDISERYLLEVTDAQGRPVHDAEVAVQRPGIAQPVAWARTDTAGRVWLHPRAFLSPELNGERTLGVAVRKNGVQSRALLTRGQANAVQVRLGVANNAPVRLDLVFLIDATGSMGDEIAKLKASMRAMAQQISQLPGQPDICYGLVAYRDRGDAFITRTHDFTDDLGAFQQQLANVQAHGGGDTPEALNEALHEVVHGLSWRTQAARMVVLVADAPPHLDYGGCTAAPDTYGVSPPRGQRAVLGRPGDCPQYDRDMQAALAKGIKLFAVGASGLDPVGEYIYRQMAQYTAGRFVFLTYRDAANPGSGPGDKTLHDVKQYSVQTLDKLVVRLVSDELARLKRS